MTLAAFVIPGRLMQSSWQRHRATKMLADRSKISGLVRLTRWKEHIPFVLPLTALGAIMAAQASGTRLDGKLWIVALANVLTTSYSFMINDIEDAADDARDARRAARNAIACGELTSAQGWAASLATAALALGLYGVLGGWPLVLGAFMMALGHLYSWKRVRLKSLPVADVVSHSLMLGGLLYLTGYFAYGGHTGPFWLITIAVTAVSAYGQFYNQLRDLELDQAAGLRTTTILLGARMARALMFGSAALASILLLYALWTGLVPVWVALTGALIFGLVVQFVRIPNIDARGGTALDAGGGLQIQGLIAVNASVAIWLAVALLRN